MLKRVRLHQLPAACLVLALLRAASLWADDPLYKYEKPPTPSLVQTSSNQPPVAVINATATSGEAPFLVQLTSNSFDPDGSLANVSWDFGNGDILSGSAATYSYSLPGAYKVTLTVTDELGASASASLDLTATTTDWALDGSVAPIVEKLGPGWVQTGKTIACLDGQDGGSTQIKLPYAPNGIHDLWLRVLCNPNYRNDPHPRFRLEGQTYDLTPQEDLGYQWVFIKPVQVINNTYQLGIKDLRGGGIQIRRFRLEPHESEGDPAFSINAEPSSGNVPLKVGFSVQGAVTYLWDFGDGTTSDKATPVHTYENVGTYLATLSAVDTTGQPIVTSAIINVEPDETSLPGLADVQAFGLYSVGLKVNSGQSEDVEQYNLRRMDELQNLNVKDAYVGFWPFWYDSDEDQAGYHAFLDALHARGIRAVLSSFTVRKDWFTNDGGNTPIDQWIFDPTDAHARFQATDRDGDGISDLDGRIDVLYLAHEVLEYANYPERVQMYQVAKQYFPNTPVLMYYGGAFNLPFVRAGQPHLAGGFWEDYQFGPGETDIIHFGAGRPFVYNSDGTSQYAIQSTVDNIIALKQYADAVAPELPIWVHSSFADDETMNLDPNCMWQPNEILGWAKAIMSIGDIQGIFLRGYDRFEYDLGYGVNTEDPSQPVTGFIEQREAFQTIGQWISQGGGI